MENDTTSDKTSDMVSQSAEYLDTKINFIAENA